MIKDNDLKWAANEKIYCYYKQFHENIGCKIINSFCRDAKDALMFKMLIRRFVCFNSMIDGINPKVLIMSITVFSFSLPFEPVNSVDK